MERQDPAVKTEFKIEVDVAEEPAQPWFMVQDCSPDDYQKLRRAEEKSLENSDVNVSVTEVEEEEGPFRRKRVISERIRRSPEISPNPRGHERSWSRSPEMSSRRRSRSRSHTYRRGRRSPSPPPRVPLQSFSSHDITAKIADVLVPYFERLHMRLAEVNRRVSVLDNRMGRCEEILRAIQGQAAAPVQPAQKAQPARPPPPALPQRQYPGHHPQLYHNGSIPATTPSSTTTAVSRPPPPALPQR